ncbi:MAG: diguanylate cyclase [Jatrophihabitantaceae bacterium]
MILHPRAPDEKRQRVSDVRQWALWSIPKSARVFLLAAETIAVGATIGLLLDEQRTAAVALRCTILLILTICHTEIGKRAERVRRYLGAGKPVPRPNQLSVWSFAALLILPAGWAAGFIVVQYGHAMIQRWREQTSKPHRQLFVAAAAVLAQLAAAAVLDEGSAGGVLRGQLVASLSVLTAAAVFAVVNLGVIFAGMWLAARPPSIRVMLPDSDALGYELASLAVGVAVAEMLLHTPWLAFVTLVPVAYLHRSSMVKTLHQASRTDSKTGLLNTAAWMDHASGVASRCARAGQPIAVLVIDIDRFKTINDTGGHLLGDRVLVAVGACLRRELRGHDGVGRFGGDEFVVILDGLDLAGAELVSNRLRNALGEIQVESLQISVSIGLVHAAAQEHLADVEQLLQRADSALYRAKASGRDRVCVAESIGD